MLAPGRKRGRFEGMVAGALVTFALVAVHASFAYSRGETAIVLPLVTDPVVKVVNTGCVEPEVICATFCAENGGKLRFPDDTDATCFCAHPKGYGFNIDVKALRQQLAGEHGTSK